MRLERENKKLLADNLRLDTENDNLARELLTSKIEMRKDIDQIEDTKEFYEKELETTKSQLAEAIDEKTRLSGTVFTLEFKSKLLLTVLLLWQYPKNEFSTFITFQLRNSFALPFLKVFLFCFADKFQ